MSSVETVCHTLEANHLYVAAGASQIVSRWVIPARHGDFFAGIHVAGDLSIQMRATIDAQAQAAWIAESGTFEGTFRFPGDIVSHVLEIHADNPYDTDWRGRVVLTILEQRPRDVIERLADLA
jgi:hypothetical protein